MINKKMLFVYGSLKKNFCNHVYLQNCKLIASDVLTANNFAMYPSVDYRFPYLFTPNEFSKGKIIKGDLYEVDVFLLNEVIDILECVESHRYSRQKTKIKLKGNAEIEAEIYIANYSLLESDEIDMIPVPLNEWNKELEKIGILTELYIKCNRRNYEI